MNLQELYRKIELPEEVRFVIERMRTDIPEQMLLKRIANWLKKHCH